MSLRVHLYDAFSGINSGDKSALIKFLHKNSEERNVSTIRDAIDYALKNKPSFGGFIFSAWDAGRPIAVVLVNETGMSGFAPSYQLVYAHLDETYPDASSVLKNLIQRTMRHVKGEIGLHLKPDSPALPIFRSLGFQEQYLELRFNKQRTAASAS